MLGEAEVAQIGVLTAAGGREIRMFAGLTSRWTSPRACAASSAEAIWPTRPTARSGSSRPETLEEPGQVAPLHVAHRDVEHAVRLAGVVDRDDVRMLERRGDLRLAEEALAEPLVRESSGVSTLSATRRSSETSSAE